MKPSVAEFMAYVHTSVNEESQMYLANERRYNYTTPKSFLEQVWTVVFSDVIDCCAANNV